MSEVELIRGRWNPNLHPVLRVLKSGQLCHAYGLPQIDEHGDEWVRLCQRPRGHTGRHLDWDWEGAGQEIFVWTDAVSVAF